MVSFDTDFGIQVLEVLAGKDQGFADGSLVVVLDVLDVLDVLGVLDVLVLADGSCCCCSCSCI